MDVAAALKGQYHASLAMLKDAIEQCGEDLWERSDNAVPFWRVAYHTLFFTHMYLQRDRASFHPWEHHRDEYHYLGKKPRLKDCKPYTKTDVLEYWTICDGMVDGAVDAMDLDAVECGFSWYRLPKLDHQINNIRHIQHHAAILSARLRAAPGAEVQWRGFD